jgi:hypothetical protein
MNLGIKNLKKKNNKKIKRIEKLIESQKRALKKFVTSNKQNIIEKLDDSSTNEQEIHFKELEDNIIIPSKDTNENNPYDSQLKDNNKRNPNASQSKDTNENIQNDSQKCNIPTYDNQSKDTKENNLNDSQSKDTNENIPNDDQNFYIPTFDEEHEKNLEANEYINETLDYRPLNIYDSAQWKNIDSKLRDLLVEKGPIRHNDSEFPKDGNSRHFSTTYYTRTLPNVKKHDRK